jgi:ABC-type transport system substrate-binding protein
MTAAIGRLRNVCFSQLVKFSIVVGIIAILSGSAVSKANELRLLDDFPAPMKFRHLGDWQRFDISIVNATAVKLLSFRNGVYVPDFAESWSVSSDGKEFQFKLRKNVVFEDGTPITSENAALAINRHISLKGQNGPLLEKILQRVPKKDRTMSGQFYVDARQRDLLVIKLNNPYPDFLGILSMLSFSIFKEEDLAPEEDLIKPRFKASGPYKLKFISQQQIVI